MLTLERLKELLHYDPATGQFTHAKQRGNVAAGQVAGNRKDDGYLRTKLDGKFYRLNRLAVFYMTGAWPEGDVDHQNRNRADNSWDNLRVLTRAANLQNTARARRRSTSGLVGAHRSGLPGKWTSAITANGVTHRLGMFDSPEEASAAYLAAKARLHPSYVPASAMGA